MRVLLPLALVALALTVALPALPRQLTGRGGCETPFVEFDAPDAPRVYVEVADTPEARARGLMHREWLDPDAGMLFVFEGPVRAAFWMKDTLLSLSIAFIAADGSVVDIQDMEPLSLEPHAPPAEYLYALETNAGWFAEHGVGAGARAWICFGGPAEAE